MAAIVRPVGAILRNNRVACKHDFRMVRRSGILRRNRL
jgi:hypothetical protein